MPAVRVAGSVRGVHLRRPGAGPVAVRAASGRRTGAARTAGLQRARLPAGPPVSKEAVELAELGDLSGRAVQAVLLTREDVSPVQVAVADQTLAGDPLGGEDLFLRLDLTAASVAAAHWLQAAADVVAVLSGIPVTQVVAESDNIEALSHATPTAVLELMESGSDPDGSRDGPHP
jgi:hypothetical protein